MTEVERPIVYFENSGEVNTRRTLELGCRRAAELGVRSFIVASETGRSALQAVEILRGSGLRLVVVPHYPATTWGPHGDIPIGLNRPEYRKTSSQLEDEGAAIVQGTRPFAPPSRSVDWDYPTPEGMVDRALTLFGAGTKIAIETAIMAADAAAVAEGEEIVSCAGTFKGLDTALVVRAAYSMDFWRDLEVLETVARPRHRVHRLPEYEWQNWKGDLDAYYGHRQGVA